MPQLAELAGRGRAVSGEAGRRDVLAVLALAGGHQGGGTLAVEQHSSSLEFALDTTGH
jgi:hypothetical protein